MKAVRGIFVTHFSYSILFSAICNHVTYRYSGMPT